MSSIAEIGDVFDGLPLPRLEEFELVSSDDPPEPFVRVVFTLAVVVGVYQQHAVVAPITTRNDVGDPEAYTVLVERGRTADLWIRLPVLAGIWDHDAVASLFQPGTLPFAVMANMQANRIAGMTDAARGLLQRRFARAWLQ